MTFRFSVFGTHMHLHVHDNLTRSLEIFEQQLSSSIRRSVNVQVLIYIYIYIYIYTFIYFPPNSHLRHRALSLAPPAPLRGGTKNDGSYADTFNTGEAPLSRRTGSRSPCHYSHQSWCTGVWIRFGLPRCNLFIPGFF